MKRRPLLCAALPAMAWLARPAAAAPAAPRMRVFRSPSCGCCGVWIDHIKAAGFEVQVTEVADTSAARRRHGMPDRIASCHTGIVDGYVVEGHVPAAEVKRLLAARPIALGLAVPGMPIGSPGMEAGDCQDPYAVLLIDKNGRDTVFARYPKT